MSLLRHRLIFWLINCGHIVKERMQMDQQKNERINWIDCAKLIAMIAVLVDHSNNLLYSDVRIAYASYFSVSFFVILSGISLRGV